MLVAAKDHFDFATTPPRESPHLRFDRSSTSRRRAASSSSLLRLVSVSASPREPPRLRLGGSLLTTRRRVLVDHETSQRERVPEHLDGGDGRAEEDDAGRDEEDVLEHACQREHQPARRADQEHGGDVEEERDERVRRHDEEPDPGDRLERREALREGQEAGVDEGAHLGLVEEVNGITHGSVVVQRAQRVHFQTLEEDLDHDEARRLELVVSC